MYRGIFITFEGGEGCGKSFQAKALYRRLVSLAIPAVLTHEPGGTPLGEKITRLLKWDEKSGLSALTETFLFNASRSILIDTVIKPALMDNKIVVCDRFVDSTIVYQGYARGLNVKLINELNSIASQDIKPVLSILLDVPAEIGLNRKSKLKQDRFHKENLGFHRNVRNGFITQAARDPGRWLTVDGTQSKNNISGIIWDKVSHLISVYQGLHPEARG